MRVLSFLRDGRIHLGLPTDEGVVDVTAAAREGWPGVPGLPATMEELMEAGEGGLQRLKSFQYQWGLHRHLSKALSPALHPLNENAIEYAPVVTCPEKIVCIGFNYASHAEEIGAEAPEFPEVFSVSNNALAAHRQAIRLPSTARLYDYEAELVVVIGRECSMVSKDNALDYVFGYTCGNDISARELQGRTGQWYMGKSLDGFAPVGPWIATADSLDPTNLSISMKRGDEVVQNSNTQHLIFDCAYIVSYLSQYMTLRAGDLIFTGTPSGVVVGKPKGERKWVAPGETLTVSIEGIGELVNTTV